MQGRMKRSILILYLTLLFGLSSACLPIVAGSGEEGNKTATTEAIQPQFTPLPPFKEESISPGNMQAYSFLSSSGQELDRAFLKSCQTTLASTDSVTFTAILSKNAKKKKEIVGLVVHAFGTLIKIADFKKALKNWTICFTCLTSITRERLGRS